MATEVRRHEVRRTNEWGRVSYHDTFVVVFDRWRDPSEWTSTAAEQAVIDAGHTFGSAHPEESGCLLRSFDTTQSPDADHIFYVVANYSTFAPSSSHGNVNDERIDTDGGTKTITEYYDTANNPLDDNEGKHGVQKNTPTEVIRVRRIHSTSKRGTWETYACKVNSSTVTTPGGVTLSSTAKELLFLECSERQIDDNKFECVYIFVKDLTRIGTGSGVVALLHREPVATVDKATGKVTSVSLKDVYETAAIGSAMADE